MVKNLPGECVAGACVLCVSLMLIVTVIFPQRIDTRQRFTLKWSKSQSCYIAPLILTFGYYVFTGYWWGHHMK